MKVINVEHLTKDYGFNRGVFDISFSISTGEVYGFLGPNGAGKSTTIRHLIGFSKPDKGKTEIYGLDTFNHYSEILGKVGYLPGEIALPDGLTGYEFIDMMKKLRHVKDNKRIDDLIQRFEVDPSGETKRMSFGNKRKLAIVAAFIHDPEILILDEPTSGLDPVMQEIFIQFIKEEKNRGKTVLLSSHIFSEVEALCNRVSIIKEGHIIDEFSMSKLKHADNKVYKVKLETEEEVNKVINKLNNDKYAQCDKQEENILYIQINDKDINRLINDLSIYNVLDFAHEKLTLEEYFMQYYIGDMEYKGVIS
ncbi:MAG TPA: ABC transporter ATP-binding protein [Haloplasmataceae bacterium]